MSPVGAPRSDERRAYHREYDRERKLRDPEYAAKRAQPPARTEARREVERRYEERRRQDPEKVEAKRESRRASRERNVEKVRAADRRRHTGARAEGTRARARAWELAHPEETRERKRLMERGRRARKRGVACEPIEPLVVLERDDGVCGICGGDVDPFDFHVDHRVPLARGGTHTYDNVQVAHPDCNVRKGAALPEED